MLNGPTKGIISYLKSRHTRSVAHYRMKMMIVGAAERGKTTLLHQLIQTQTSASKRNLATMGVSVKQWTYQHRRPAGNVVNYHINCWDFAGQDEFYSTHQCFLSQRSLYVVSIIGQPLVITGQVDFHVRNFVSKFTGHYIIIQKQAMNISQ